jgi:hypothetical protein
VLDDICVLLKHEISVIRLHPAYSLPSVGASDEILCESFRYTMATFGLAGAVPLDALWDKFGNIYLSTNNTELIILDENLVARTRSPMPSNIFTMTLTHRYVIVATSDNKLKWLNVYYPPDVDVSRGGKNEKDMNLKVK